MNKAIFIGGIHGVGKTTLCDKLLKKLDIKHYSASSLIKKLDKSVINDKNKSVIDINKNQDKLITAIDNYVDKTKTYLLDGHFCLLDSSCQVIKIPKQIFKKINPVGIIIVRDEVENIQTKNTNRDYIHYENKLLDSFQNKELEYSKYIAEWLQVPYMIFDVNTEIDIIENFIKIIKKSQL